MMAGVVRRDGLREAIEAALMKRLDDWFASFSETYQQPVGSPGWCHGLVSYQMRGPDAVSTVLDAVPDVPPDPPTVDVEKVAWILGQHRLIINYGDCMCRCGEQLVKSMNDSDSDVRRAHQAHVAAYLASSGVLVDAADVRARVADLEAGIRRLIDWCERDPRNHASKRDLRALVGDETPGTGEGA